MTNCAELEVLLSGTDTEIHCFTDSLGVNYLLHVVHSSVTPNAGDVERTYTTETDGETPYVPVGGSTPCEDIQMFATAGHIKECTVTDDTFTFHATAQFTANEIIFDTVDAGRKYRKQVRRAQEVQTIEERAGGAITPFRIQSSTGEEYWFNPNGFVELQPENRLPVDPASIVSWGALETSAVVNAEFSRLTDCECKPVKMYQKIDNDGVITMVDVVSTHDFDPITREEVSLLTDGLLPFGTVGVFTGSCPPCREWAETLCDDGGELLSLSALSVESNGVAAGVVQAVDLVTGAITDQHTNANPLSPAAAYHRVTDTYYVFSETTNEWLTYNAGNLTAGSTNLGVFTGDVIAAQLSWGAIDPTTGLGHFGTSFDASYVVDFVAGTITETLALTAPAGYNFIGGLAIDNNGQVTAMVMNDPEDTVEPSMYIVDFGTGTLVQTATSPIYFRANGHGQITDEVTGDFIGYVSVDRQSDDPAFYFWTDTTMADIQRISGATASGGGSVDGRFGSFVDQVTPFQRRYSECNGDVHYEDFTLDGCEYEVQGAVKLCEIGADPNTTVVTETGCLTDPASFSLSGVDRCPVVEVVINGESVVVDLSEGWSVQEFIDAVNAVRPGTFEMQDGSIVVTPESAYGNVELVCVISDFLESFGTTAGAQGQPVQPLTSPPLDNTGATSTYPFSNDSFLPEGEYHVGRIQDNRPANTDMNMGLGAAAVDATGNTDGNALSVNASSDVGTFYEQTADGLIIGNEYQVTIHYASLNPNFGQGDISKADVSLQIFAGATLLAQFDTGLIDHDATWHRADLRFVSTSTQVTYRAVNNSPNTAGNDLALDEISFARVSRRLFALEQRGEQLPVEIVKVLNGFGTIERLRVFSPDGLIEYPIPDVKGRILSTGSCQQSNVETGCGCDVSEINSFTAGIWWETPAAVAAGALRITFINVGTTDATVAGAPLPPNVPLVFDAVFDHAAGEYRRLSQIDFIASATSRLAIWATN